jgi:hypothetical protein
MQEQAANLAQVVNVFKLEQFAETDLQEEAPAIAEAPVETSTVAPLKVAAAKSSTGIVPRHPKLAAAVRTGTDDWMEF